MSSSIIQQQNITNSHSKYCQPRINNPLGCLIGRVPLKYQMMNIGGVPPYLINHGLVSSGVDITVLPTKHGSTIVQSNWAQGAPAHTFVGPCRNHRSTALRHRHPPHGAQRNRCPRRAATPGQGLKFAVNDTHMLHVWNMNPYIYPKNQPNVGKHSIHGASGIQYDLSWSYHDFIYIAYGFELKLLGIAQERWGLDG